MNSIYAVGGTKSKRALAEHIADWYIKKYLNRFKNIEVFIDIKKLDPEYYGFCVHAQEKEFVIEISNKIKGQEFITAVIHEMIHVKQYIRSELECVGFDIRWKKSFYSNIDYDNHPWEKEAYKLEKIITESYISENPQIII